MKSILIMSFFSKLKFWKSKATEIDYPDRTIEVVHDEIVPQKAEEVKPLPKESSNVVKIDNKQFGKLLKGIYLVKKDTSMIPGMQGQLVKGIKEAISDELSKVKLPGKTSKVKLNPLTQRLHERIDQVATSFIPGSIHALLLKNNELTFTELLDATGTTKPTLSKHLDQMMERGEITKTKVGKFSYYRLSKPPQVNPLTYQVNTSKETSKDELS